MRQGTRPPPLPPLAARRPADRESSRHSQQKKKHYKRCSNKIARCAYLETHPKKYKKKNTKRLCKKWGKVDGYCVSPKTARSCPCHCNA